MIFCKRKKGLPWDFKKYIYLLNDFTNLLLKKERQQEDRRVHNLMIELIILVVVLFISFAYNVYLATGA